MSVKRPLLIGVLLLTGILSLLNTPAHAIDLFGRVTEREVMAQTIAGKMTRIRFPSAALGEGRTMYIYTPPDYDTDRSKVYPVIVLLHGTPGACLDWAGKGDCNRRFEKAVAAGKIPPAILVFPDGHGPHWKGGSEWADDVSGQCKMETAITSDLPHFLKAHYRVSPDPNQWTIGGLSEGGYGAANLTVRHPDVFRNALIFSGDFKVKDEWDDDDKVFGSDPAVRSANSPLEAIHNGPTETRRKLRFYIAIGMDDDEDLQTEGALFMTTAKSLGADGRFVREPGKHAWDFWSNQFSASLPYLGKWLAETR